ncbi:thioredoxin domain-containing protein [Myroides phaeus]|uniref:thioredoxin domain-containing protein n=1 Tax=Myroides phaeus TaxID=702745 RepID=UPI001303418C|nr:thioredoxin domain-containing protein [Myroides phaeus]
MNELHTENSPYLLQHANNPIYWKAWNQKTLESALQQDKLIVVSIGYSTCHWCHVMEHESFENAEVATLMNEHYISIKIDREEHPDIDNFYMKAVQLMTKQGGWPLNVVCLPDGRPVWGGTYFKKEAWTDSLEQLKNLYRDRKDTVIDFAEKLSEGISILSLAPQYKEESRFNLDIVLDKWKNSFDPEYGGYNRAPKFMMPTNLLYLQKLGFLKSDNDLLEHIDLTLTKMAYGGLFDTVEGGFSRYSVDFKWHVPHFEKMLYDNAQLLSVYADAYKRTSNPLYSEIIDKTIKFIFTNWDNKQGGFYSALDADSLNANSKLVEGAFYTWTKKELQEFLQDDFDLFSIVFNINEFGYWEEGQYVLIQNKSLEEIALSQNIALSDLYSKKCAWEALLLEKRNLRAKPRLDDKTITSWNAMLITGLLDAYTATHNQEYLNRAIKLEDFIHSKLWSEDGGLFRTFKNDKATIEAFLDDYGFYIQALINLFEHTAEEKYIKHAKNIVDLSLDKFLDHKSSFFLYSAKTNKNITPAVEIEDNVIPSSNAIMAMNLLKLGVLFENAHYTQIATDMTKVVLSQIDYPSAYSHWLLLDLYLQHPIELSFVGENAKKQALKIRDKMISRAFIFSSTTDSTIPYLAKYGNSDSTLHYICMNSSCLKPEENVTALEKYTL